MSKVTNGINSAHPLYVWEKTGPLLAGEHGILVGQSVRRSLPEPWRSSRLLGDAGLLDLAGAVPAA